MSDPLAAQLHRMSGCLSCTAHVPSQSELLACRRSSDLGRCRRASSVVMLEYGSAGPRVFGLSAGDKPKEAAYSNDRKGHVHSDVFHYEALGLLTPTGPDYPHDK